jgi:hypothetical protein
MSGMREYKLRLPREIPEATSETVAAWLDEASESKTKLAADPGGGAVRISLSLDPEKVVAFANARREKVHVALRRLIASHVKIETAPEGEESPAAAEARELVPERILPRKLAYDAEDFIDFVHGADKGLAFVYRKVHRLDDLKPAETPAEDRKLAGAMAEVCNRRSPAWMLANADLVKLAMTSFRWGIAQTEDLDGRAREGKSRAKENRAVINVSAVSAPAAPAESITPDTPAPPPSPMAKAAIAADEMQHLEAAVQQEGEF